MIYKSNEKTGPLAPMGPTCPPSAPNAALEQIKDMLDGSGAPLTLGRHASGRFLCTEGIFLMEAYCDGGAMVDVVGGTCAQLPGAPDFVQIDIHVHGEGCTAHCTDGRGNPLASVDLGRQPLSMDGLTLLFVEGTLLLPCEY